jgi:hypothetical protein
MTSQELRIAKLSKILNNSSLNKDVGSPVIQAAYKRAYDDLQDKIKGEKAYHQETEARQRVQHSIEKQEEQLKESMRKHHFNVLKKQIEDRKKRREINEVEKLLERPKSLPKTPPEPPKFFIREGLKDQIREKRKRIRESQKTELDYDRFLIKVAKNSLEDDIRKKKQAKNEVFEELKESWNDARVINGLKKQADRLKYFANTSVNQTTSPKNKVKYFSRGKNKTSENSPVKETKANEKVFNTEQKQLENKNNGKQDPEKEEILKKLEKIDERSKKIEQQKEILKKIQEIEEYEKNLGKEKKAIIEYLASKGKTFE